MKTWKKITFVVVLISFIALSLSFTFFSIARDTFEYRQKDNIDGIDALNGWEFYGFNGNSDTTEIHIDYVRDVKGNNPDNGKPIIAVGDFTVVSDEYVQFIYIGKDVQYIADSAFYYSRTQSQLRTGTNNETKHDPEDHHPGNPAEHELPRIGRNGV